MLTGLGENMSEFSDRDEWNGDEFGLSVCSHLNGPFQRAGSTMKRLKNHVSLVWLVAIEMDRIGFR